MNFLFRSIRGSIFLSIFQVALLAGGPFVLADELDPEGMTAVFGGTLKREPVPRPTTVLAKRDEGAVPWKGWPAVDTAEENLPAGPVSSRVEPIPVQPEKKGYANLFLPDPPWLRHSADHSRAKARAKRSLASSAKHRRSKTRRRKLANAKRRGRWKRHPREARRQRAIRSSARPSPRDLFDRAA